MTAAQRRRLYFPAWRAAFEAVWEKAPCGRIRARADAAASEIRDAIEALARRWAEAEARGVTETDLRHAANALALQRARTWRSGRPQPLPDSPSQASSRHLDGLSLSLFMALCHLLEDPTWLGRPERPGMIQWTDPGQIERARLLWQLDHRGAPGYAAAVSRSMYGTRDYHTLALGDLIELHRLLRGRAKAWRPQASTHERAPI